MSPDPMHPSEHTGAVDPDLSQLFEPYVWQWFQDTFAHPSPPQVAAWPKIAEGSSTLIFSPTGSGKTLAAFLWCINELFRMASREALDDAVYVLYVSPLKALNNDIQKNLVEPLEGIRRYAEMAGLDIPEVRSRVRTGDTTSSERASMARRPPHILITTPESLYIILTTAKFREAFRKVKYVIVDEIHAISDNKRGVHLSLSLERLQHLVGDPFVRIGLSATQRPLDLIARFLVGVDDSGEPRPCEIVDVSGRKDLNVKVISPVDNLLEARFDAIWGSAYDKMIRMVRERETTLIFANSRYKTERTALRLTELSSEEPILVGAHHGSMSKQVRLNMEDQLKSGALDALVATSSLELGIDVGSIDLVCQIQSPKSVSRGLQRIGRSGHLLDATSEGRLLVTDRDDLVESAVLVRGIMQGKIDTTRIPTNCLDVLAQQVVAAVASDEWHVDDLFALCRHSFCYRDLTRTQFDDVLDMLAGNYSFEMARAPYPKILWDKVNDLLSPERSARLIAFTASGTIPDVANYDVWFEERKTRVGQLDEGFVEELHPGDIFILGSSSWRVLGIRRNRVLVEDVYGLPPTIPFWGGDRASRTYDLGRMVGAFRRDIQEHLDRGDTTSWLQKEHYVDDDGAQAIESYFREQRLVTPRLPSDNLVLVEHCRDELGQRLIVIHSSFGIHVNDPWAMALCQAIEDRYGCRLAHATVDDGILITIPRELEEAVSSARPNPEDILSLATPDNLDDLLERAVLESPLFASRFRHNAVRSLLVLRNYRGRRTPVWLQGLRASAILETCGNDLAFPVIVESLRECLSEAMDVPNLHRVLDRVSDGDIETAVLETRIPSPFTHSLLLLGQTGDSGAIPARERRSRLMHLHRELLRQILDEETLRNLLDEGAVAEVEARLQRRHPQRRAQDANELARALIDLGDLVEDADEEISLLGRVEGDLQALLADLVEDHRAIRVPIPTVETHADRWIATENYALYRDAFARSILLGEQDRGILSLLKARGPLSARQIKRTGAETGALDRLVRAYQILPLPSDGVTRYVAVDAWVPASLRGETQPDATPRGRTTRESARLALIEKHLRCHGPVTKYDIMERYGFAEGAVEQALEALVEGGIVARGEYVPTKAFPQWCHKGNLEEIHRLTLNQLRKEMEPATPEEYTDFLVRWQHVHPETQLEGTEGLLQIIGQLQGLEQYQVLFERDVFPSRVRDYAPGMLDELVDSGQVRWRRFDYRRIKRGSIGFHLRRDRHWLLFDPKQVEMDLRQWDDDIPEACDSVREHLRTRGASYFDDIVSGTGVDWRYALRAVWHLAWTGEATNDGYESIRHSRFTTGLSGCYDLATRPTKKGVTLDFIVHHMIDLRNLDPRRGRWAPTERLIPEDLDPPEGDVVALAWVNLLLSRYGVLSKETLRKSDVAAPPWRDLRRALVRLELLGKVRRGYFLQDLSGEQFASPEALEELHVAKLRHLAANDVGDGKGSNHASRDDEPMILLNACDPACPYGTPFPVRTALEETVKFPYLSGSYLVVQAGRPVLLCKSGRGVTLLQDLTRPRAESALRALMRIAEKPAWWDDRTEVNILDWNGHPIDVSPARHLLVTLGFIKGTTRWKGLVYDGTVTPDPDLLEAAEAEMPEVFEHKGKEEAPAVYDEAWVVGRTPEAIRAKTGEFLPYLRNILPEGFEVIYWPRGFNVQYKGVRCAMSYFTLKNLHLHITHRGWVPPIKIAPNTTLGDAFTANVMERFEHTAEMIDETLARRQGREERVPE